MAGTRIIDVLRKPRICPVCKEGEVFPIVYGTGDYTEIDFLLEYGKTCIMGGDNIPRRPPMWECSACGKRFRKVNPDGTDASVKLRLLKNEKHDGKIQFTDNNIEEPIYPLTNAQYS